MSYQQTSQKENLSGNQTFYCPINLLLTRGVKKKKKNVEAYIKYSVSGETSLALHIASTFNK